MHRSSDLEDCLRSSHPLVFLSSLSHSLPSLPNLRGRCQNLLLHLRRVLCKEEKREFVAAPALIV